MVTFADAQQTALSIVKSIHPLSVVVFGSVAREGSGTDLDLLVVMDDEQTVEGNIQKTLHKALRKYYRKYPIDPFVVTKSALKDHYLKGSPFIKTIEREGRLLYMKNIIEEWLDQSREEMETGKYLLDGGFYKSSCYHAQQSIEKTIKAILLSKGWSLEKIHSIARLVALCGDYRIKLPLDDGEVIFLDGIYRGRYPAEEGLLPLGSPTRDDAVMAVGIAEKVQRAAGRLLKK